MRARIVWIVAGIAVVIVAVWVLMRDGPERPRTAVQKDPSTTPSGDVKGTPGPARSFPPPARRVLPPPGSPPPPAAADFDADARDAAWADPMERDLATRLEAIQIEATEIDCRRRSCKLELQATDVAALSAAISRLEEPGGLVGVVDGIVVTAPESLGGTGAVRVVVYAEVDR